jgi:hypothetical protein
MINILIIACGLNVLANTAISPDAKQSEPAIAALREAGPAGLDALFAVPVNEVSRERWKTAVDAVAKQKDAYASRLYWHTDFEKAKAAAKASGKPILSLRLLGNLDEEFSCANSRFFRTALYANAEVSHYLREHFVLHWKSVRPAPRVTIDFGDGRKLERTITGNSIHYVLNPDGRVIDALPGLYGPKAFLKLLVAAEQYGGDVRAFHARQLQRPASFEAEDVRLDAASRALMVTKFPTAFEAGRVAMSKTMVENPLLRAIQTFERSLAEDTRHNETVLHRRVHEWFVNDEVGDVDALNERVYAELFLTPSNDPWLGLVEPTVYTALEKGGLKQ